MRTNRPVQKIVGSLKKGRRVLGKGTLRNFRGSGTLKLRFSKRKKLKAGRYSVVVKATEASGRSLTRTLRLRVRR